MDAIAQEAGLSKTGSNKGFIQHTKTRNPTTRFRVPMLAGLARFERATIDLEVCFSGIRWHSLTCFAASQRDLGVH
jgi:hypothetical protein